MRGTPGISALLIPGLLLAGAAEAGCLALDSHPDGAALARVDAGPAPAGLSSSFTLAYLHSVTRTRVEERYRLDGATIVQTEIRFVQHGPGLPTEADAGGAWRREGDVFVVSMNRPHDAIAMRVHRDQSPRLAVAGEPGAVDLAQWGDRAIVMHGQPHPCPADNASAAKVAR